MPEVYTNQFTVTLTAPYTAGSTSIGVSAAAPVAVQTGTFRVRLGNAQNTLLKVTGGAATTTWTTTPEANDANAGTGAIVYGAEWTAGALDGVKADLRSSGLSLLESHAASSSASLTLTNWQSSLFDRYLLLITNLVPATNNTELQLQVSTNGGSSYDSGSNYSWVYRYNGSATLDSGVQGGQNQTIVKLATSVSSTAANGGVCVEMHIFNPSAGYKKFIYRSWEYHQNGSFYSLDGGGAYQSATQVNALQLTMSSGNIAAGSVHIFSLPQ